MKATMRAGLAALTVGVLLAGCASKPAPIVDRSSMRPRPPMTVNPAAGQAGQTPGGVAVPGVASVPMEPPPPGFYRVKRGDTLYRIALEHGQSYQDIAQWNNLANVNQIEVDQLLRVVPLPSEMRPSVPAQASTRPAEPAASAGREGTDGARDAAVDSTIAFAWPVRGQLLGKFDEVRNKGIDIGGKAGDAVTAAADGKVVYAGNSLRGYGNLVVIKHDAIFLTAYAHNREILVKEGENVRRAQKIAEMGSSDTDRVKLHFEIRRNGKPVDPLRYLPPM